MKKHVVVVTGSRAEWGLLRPLYQELGKLGLRTSLLVTGSHLHSQSGFSFDEISNERIDNLHKVYITPEEPNLDSRDLMFKTMANALTRFAEELPAMSPDLVVILGDRYEIFAVATACRLMGVRLAHISGGEVTLGAFDDCLRHCITKLSDWHFTATDEYRRRVIQLGEDPDRVFNVGDIGLNKFNEIPFRSKAELNTLVSAVNDKFMLLTLHPETCSSGLVVSWVKPLIEILIKMAPQLKLVFTGANADPEGDLINQVIVEQARQNPERISFFSNLGRLNYLSLARFAECVAGNSSSAIIEIPGLGIPVINLGRRQWGRVHGEAVVTAAFSHSEIEAAVKKVLQPDFKRFAKTCSNPYSGENSVKCIVQIINDIDARATGNEKLFHDL